MDKKEKKLQEKKQEIKRLLEEKNEGALIYLLNLCVNDEKFEKAFEDKVPENYVDDTLQGEEFVPIEIKKYLVSNLGRIKLNNGKKPVIPQRQDENDWNWFLNVEKFKEIYKDFDGKLAGNVKIYEYFMKKTEWLNKEKAEIQEIYPDCCKFELHHICNKGDNRIDNLVYLPKCIHNKVNHNYKA